MQPIDYISQATGGKHNVVLLQKFVHVNMYWRRLINKKNQESHDERILNSENIF